MASNEAQRRMEEKLRKAEQERARDQAKAAERKAARDAKLLKDAEDKELQAQREAKANHTGRAGIEQARQRDERWRRAGDFPVEREERSHDSSFANVRRRGPLPSATGPGSAFPRYSAPDLDIVTAHSVAGNPASRIAEEIRMLPERFSAPSSDISL
jgi:hypothetical protein